MTSAQEEGEKPSLHEALVKLLGLFNVLISRLFRGLIGRILSHGLPLLTYLERQCAEAFGSSRELGLLRFALTTPRFNH